MVWTLLYGPVPLLLISSFGVVYLRKGPAASEERDSSGSASPEPPAYEPEPLDAGEQEWERRVLAERFLEAGDVERFVQVASQGPIDEVWAQCARGELEVMAAVDRVGRDEDWVAAAELALVLAHRRHPECVAMADLSERCAEADGVGPEHPLLQLVRRHVDAVRGGGTPPQPDLRPVERLPMSSDVIEHIDHLAEAVRPFDSQAAWHGRQLSPRLLALFTAVTMPEMLFDADGRSYHADEDLDGFEWDPVPHPTDPNRAVLGRGNCGPVTIDLRPEFDAVVVPRRTGPEGMSLLKFLESLALRADRFEDMDDRFEAIWE